MSTIVTMTLDEIKKLPPLSEKRKKEMDVENEKIYDAPVFREYNFR